MTCSIFYEKFEYQIIEIFQLHEKLYFEAFCTKVSKIDGNFRKKLLKCGIFLMIFQNKLQFFLKLLEKPQNFTTSNGAKIFNNCHKITAESPLESPDLRL